MATKMNAEITKRVRALGIKANDEETAREALLEILNNNGIEGMEEEDTDTLIEIAESFVEEGAANSDDTSEENAPEEETATADEDALAEEVEAEDVEEEEETAEAESGDEFDDMDRSELKTFIKGRELEIKVKKSWSDDDIRNEIRSALAEASTEEEAEETAAPVEEKKSAPAKKSATKTEKKVSKRGTKKLDPKNNAEDRKVFDCLKDLFPEGEYAYAWIASAGVTVKHIGKNSQRAMVSIESCSLQADGSIKCNMYLSTFSKQTTVLDEAGIEYEICWSGAPFMKGITLKSAVETLKVLMPNITATVQKIDKKLGENRAKMEENLAKKTAPAKKTVKK